MRDPIRRCWYLSPSDATLLWRGKRPGVGRVGRPPKPGGAAVMVSMRLPQHVAKALRAAAKRRGISQSAVVERALRLAGDLK